MRPKIVLVWFKRDLRIVDHAPLTAAVATGLPVLPLYVVEPDYWQLSTSSQRHWSFIHDSLIQLRESLTAIGQSLVIRVGQVPSVLQDLMADYDVQGIYAHEETGHLWTYARDLEVLDFCRHHGISIHDFPHGGVVRRLRSRDGWSRLRQDRISQTPLPAPTALLPLSAIDNGQIPAKDDSLFKNRISGKTQKGGRRAGLAIVQSFIHQRANRYLKSISSPRYGPDFSSRLSPHLAWGTLSEREVVHRFQEGISTLPPRDFGRRGLAAVLTRLSWRSHFMQKLEDQPDLENTSMHSFYDGLRPQDDQTQTSLSAWQDGHTGYPIIDACMRCLAETGWLPFRMRAMLVSFASYHLWLDWRLTAPHMARLFTDYEPGIHYSQFQMQSGVTGINTMRVYNPVKQSYDHDPEGWLIRQYCPELAHLPVEWVHEPYLMPPLLASEFNFETGRDYPMPIVDNQTAMREAKNKMAAIRKQAGFDQEAASVFQRLGSRNRPRQGAKKRQAKPNAQQQLDLF